MNEVRTFGSTQVNGHTVPTDLVLYDRHGSASTTKYVAARSITLLEGFDSENDELEGTIGEGDYDGGGNQSITLNSAEGGYRYGFNGKENDNEVKGTGNQQDYGMRIYDPRLGKFLSVDPITKNYPELTPYQFASNRPIDGIDLDGKEYMRYIEKQSYDGNIAHKIMITPGNTGATIWNGLAGLWNGGVDYLKDAKKQGATVATIKRFNQVNENIGKGAQGMLDYHTQTPFLQQLGDFGKFMMDWQRVEDALILFTGAKAVGKNVIIRTASIVEKEASISVSINAMGTSGEALSKQLLYNAYPVEMFDIVEQQAVKYMDISGGFKPDFLVIDKVSREVVSVFDSKGVSGSLRTTQKPFFKAGEKVVIKDGKYAGVEIDPNKVNKATINVNTDNNTATITKYGNSE